MSSGRIPGYAYGMPHLDDFPMSDEEFEQLKKTVLLSEEDFRYLRLAGEVLRDQIDDVLDLWYSWVGSNPHLVYYFGDKKTGQPIPEYLEAVRKRFGQWIRDLCERDYDREWLRYQLEIGLRHHRAKKNRTDGVNSVDHIPMRYMVAFIVPITLTIRPFLEKKGHPKEVVEKMHQAWFKAVTLSVALWCYPYAREGDW
ncbi:MAG: protoglobin domain-containing protein [Candidatus Calditenuis sp.]|nr:protoglobin domain-containing protein [Candidatus Calditenuis sp.]